ncbi:MAG: malonate-semialdehyde dehydrogenase (acetylating) / methylmalonate-semialdehyde dehydrogenase [Chloroflexota bacterium]|nr:malonate-semialdehyde dehydrogenase (acetylating) / methylmalonate-semialdehyde dehydrogenase [Chloroflexota bacterium]
MAIETPDKTAIVPILSHWIDGTAVEVLPEQTGPVTNPATGQVIARVPRGGQAEVDAAVASAKAAFPAWRDMPLIARSNIFFQFRNLMYENREELARLITRDHGKTFPDALAETLRGIETIDFACGLPVHMAGMMTPNVSTNVDAFTFRGPLGVVAAITPFNFPVMVPTWIYPIALMTGNTVILKPSSHTPGATQLQAELWTRAGGPDGTFNVVYGGRDAVKAIVEHKDIKAIQFVGSTAVGRYVYEEGTKRGKRVGSYTSAKNAMLVLPDADMDLVADAAVASGFGSAGERCMAQTLMVAVGDTAERLKPKIMDRIAKLKIGDGMEPGTDMGPIYTDEHRQSVINWINIGEAEGAELLVDGRTFKGPNPDGFFLGVTLFDHVTPEMKVYQEEIFGPVFGIVYADTFEEGLKLINDHKYANGTAVFTTDGGAARRFKLEVEVPMIGVNVPIPVPAGYMSFSGAKESAIGDLAMRGEDGVRFFTQQKMVTERWPEPGKQGPLSLVFPGNS